jgi:hypothetical protein
VGFAVKAVADERKSVGHAIWILPLPEKSLTMRQHRGGTSFREVTVDDLRQL